MRFVEGRMSAMRYEFGWDLPPGVTDSDCEPYNPECSSCGDKWDEHYHDDDDIVQPCERDVIGYDSDGLIRNAEGEITGACDIVDCECKGFED